MPFLSLTENSPGARGSSSFSPQQQRTAAPTSEILRAKVPHPHLEGLYDPSPPKCLWKLQDQVKEEGSRKMP